jgi:basic amino acid/polyamine antiporter, APA family
VKKRGGETDGSRERAAAPANEPPTSKLPLIRGLTLLGTVALVVGNMVGTSIYTLPASLADVAGPFGLVAWLFTAIGYLFVALVYARLGTRYPRTGGPYVFARAAFGDFAGFITVWSYWVSTVVGNAAIVTGAVGYLVGFFPALEQSAAGRFALAQALIWGLCILNVRGIRQSARVQTTVMFLNLVPLGLLAIFTLRRFDLANLHPFAPHGYGSLAAAAALVVWAYSGIESATVPAEEVQAPERTIRLGTMLGYAVGTTIFLLTALAVAGSLPNATIAGSARPIALAAENAVGPWAGAVIGVAAIAAALGTLNGWILMAGRIPLSAAADGVFFRPLAAVHPRYGTPATALVVGTAVSSAMLLLYFTHTLLGVFNWVVLLAVLLTLLPHLFATAAEIKLGGQAVGGRRWAVANGDDADHPASAHETTVARSRSRVAPRTIAVIAFVFVLYTIYGVGVSVILWGLVLVLAGIPLYFVLRKSGR